MGARARIPAGSISHDLFRGCCVLCYDMILSFEKRRSWEWPSAFTYSFIGTRGKGVWWLYVLSICEHRLGAIRWTGRCWMFDGKVGKALDFKAHRIDSILNSRVPCVVIAHNTQTFIT